MSARRAVSDHGLRPISRLLSMKNDRPLRSAALAFLGGLTPETFPPTGPGTSCRRGCHSILTKDFSPDNSHATQQALNRVLEHFATVL
jgi:hypothetical protein